MKPRYLTDDPIDMGRLLDQTRRDSDGALALFAGAVRNHHEGRAVESIFYEAYREMAEKELARIVEGLKSEHPDVSLAVIHRLGLLRVGEISIAIVATSSHRADAFEVCREAIERIKRTVPIWKKERSPDGETWVGWQGHSQS